MKPLGNHSDPTGYGFFFNLKVKYKYSPGQNVEFTYKSDMRTGVIFAVKHGDEPKYLLWVEDKYEWIEERNILTGC